MPYRAPGSKPTLQTAAAAAEVGRTDAISPLNKRQKLEELQEAAATKKTFVIDVSDIRALPDWSGALLVQTLGTRIPTSPTKSTLPH